MTDARPGISAPMGLLAELTHRCPLRCPYCSNPVELERRSGELNTDEWKRVFSEAQELGVLQLHLSGGEPTARRDLEDIIEHCSAINLYTNLITAGVGVSDDRWRILSDAGLDHVQLSIQAPDGDTNDRIAGLSGAFEQKIATAKQITDLGLPLTINAVVHRHNIHTITDTIDLAVSVGARRLEVAHVQYYGWGLKNRKGLIPPKADVLACMEKIEAARERLAGTLVIDAVVPDYYARFPKPCMGGWGSRSLNVTPSGTVLPCHAAETIPHLTFENVRDKRLSDIWYDSAAFNAYRGTDWMPDLCKSCDRRDVDWGGCRCQAFAFTGDAAATDPVCEKSSYRAQLSQIALEDAAADDPFVYRSF